MPVDIQYLCNNRVIKLSYSTSISLEDIDVSFNSAYEFMEKSVGTAFVIFDVRETCRILPNAIAYVN